MNNLFSIFDPNVAWLNLRINWVISFIVIFWIPGIFWFRKSQNLFLLNSLLNNLANEYKINFRPVVTPGHTHWAISLFLIILLNNLGGLTPYTFTASRHLSFSIALALVRWISYFVYRIFMNPGRFLAHLVPIGTPYVLMPIIVLIELVRNLIRPLTLSVRLAANLVAGHLLMTLISYTIPKIVWIYDQKPSLSRLEQMQQFMYDFLASFVLPRSKHLHCTQLHPLQLWQVLF